MGNLTAAQNGAIECMGGMPVEGQEMALEWIKTISKIYAPIGDNDAIADNISRALDSLEKPIAEKAIEETEEIALLTDYRKLDREGREIVQAALETALHPETTIEYAPE